MAHVVSGQVQGVGFRPFVWRIATRHKLTGFTRNTSHGVRVEVQGAAQDIRAFRQSLLAELPPLARVSAVTDEELEPVAGEKAFVILESVGLAGQNVLAAPDVAPCADCLAEMRDPADPRHNYPFISCTNCGPRFSIIKSLPYDRATTTMGCFPLCPLCGEQYGNPADRRFHAQPVACPVCGPKTWFVAASEPANGGAPNDENCRDALQKAAALLQAGQILAIKGLGGFQLACDATNARAVMELRRRKNRPRKALALMARDIAACRQFCELSPEEEEHLLSGARPIVLCAKKKESGIVAGELIAPDTDTIGVMLPATPLHALLFDRLGAIPLVMTSANPQGEPLCLGNREALERLAMLADGWLLHDRDILARVDDSVLRLARGPAAKTTIFLRRARGYVPTPISLPGAGPCVLGAGAELKATFCLTRGDKAFPGQHIGDLENPAAQDFYRQSLEHFLRLLEVSPQAIVRDLHPDFASSVMGAELAARLGVPIHGLQHHAAHAASVLAEHQCLEPALCLCLDGTGLGCDGAIWGGELIYMDAAKARWHRAGHLETFALPGGDAATRNPWRIALALQKKCGICAPLEIPQKDRDIVGKMLDMNLNCPLTSSCGRLFDAVAAQLGLCERITYEGQAAILLETCALAWIRRHGLPAPWPLAMQEGEMPQISGAALFGEVCRGLLEGISGEELAAGFHASLIDALADLAAVCAPKYGVAKVGLSGGVLQNSIIAEYLPAALIRRGLTPLLHARMPPGDGGISLGQAFFGQRMLANGLL